MDPNSTVGRNRCGRSTGMRFCTWRSPGRPRPDTAGSGRGRSATALVTKVHAVWPAIDSLGLPVVGSKLTSEFAGTAADCAWADVPGRLAARPPLASTTRQRQNRRDRCSDHKSAPSASRRTPPRQPRRGGDAAAAGWRSAGRHLDERHRLVEALEPLGSCAARRQSPRPSPRGVRPRPRPVRRPGPRARTASPHGSARPRDSRPHGDRLACIEPDADPARQLLVTHPRAGARAQSAAPGGPTRTRSAPRRRGARAAVPSNSGGERADQRRENVDARPAAASSPCSRV